MLAESLSTLMNPESHSNIACYLTTWVGDYHAPRLKALDDLLRKNGGHLLVGQFGGRSKFYSHAQTRRNELLADMKHFEFSTTNMIALAREVWTFLRAHNPGHIFVLGYGDVISLTACVYARTFGKRVYFMSESKADDYKRSQLVEWIKSKLLDFYDGGLVGGHRHRCYFRSLGFRGPLEIGYDVIDNDYFHQRSAAYSRKMQMLVRRKLLPDRYVVCVSRLVKRKRVPSALKLFANSGVAQLGVKFLLVGEGPESSAVASTIDLLGIESHVIHYRKVDNRRMPAVYCGALALILASEYDQWGLCINEAMSCGVPPLVTYRCGAAGELVTEDNGFIFEEENLEQAAYELYKLVSDTDYRRRCSTNCLATMARWNKDRFATGAGALIERFREPILQANAKLETKNETNT